jgi:hypothetical protein
LPDHHPIIPPERASIIGISRRLDPMPPCQFDQ